MLELKERREADIEYWEKSCSGWLFLKGRAWELVTNIQTKNRAHVSKEHDVKV